MKKIAAAILVVMTLAACAAYNARVNRSLAKKLTIKIYSINGCEACEHEKVYLDSLGVLYDVYIVDDDPKRAQYAADVSKQDPTRVIFPVTVIKEPSGKEHVRIGFDNRQKHLLFFQLDSDDPYKFFTLERI